MGNITLVDTQRAVIKQLHNKFDYKIYAEHIPQGFEKPSFFVYMLPLESTHSAHYMEHSVIVKIKYFGDTNSSKWEMADELAKLFSSVLPIKDRKITVTRTNQEIVDDHLEFTVRLHFEVGTAQIVVNENDEGEEVYTIVDETSGYTDGQVELARELNERMDL
ncbi:phage tail terminator family protein [Salsuginibacillus kocurii]|uniref:phage tail terminator family protein n=1 Tax=Salsuginibacillus kocurii TaxID=427078 RepID=UPI000372FB91|nr:hypothetical protein [Salsuginibacillus kocurii]